MANEKEASRGRLGTFAGVFTPSILTILGIILFLRLGYVVGAAGIGWAIVIILVANSISVLTSLSLATIATNLRVKGGGDYYLISRTLGVEFGGALGIVLFLAQSVSIAFYAIGFGEGVCNTLTDAPAWAPQAIAAAAVAGLFVLAWLGADVATKFQYVVMAILFTAILAFFVGGFSDWDLIRFEQSAPQEKPFSFWLVFAIFFPAVTGFTQGVSMSGDLKDPAKSLPRGTFLAVGISAAIYIAVALLFAGAVSGSDLVSNLGAMRDVSPIPWLIDAGVIAATLSSALASFLGGPRILQSLSQDRVFPILRAFAAGHGSSQNPRRAVLLSAAIAFGTIAIGKLDLIAPIVSMFFLVSYGLLNYATYFEARTRSPSFRPTFRFFHPRLSLLGGLLCLGAMLAINPAAGVIAVAILFGIYQYIRRNAEVARWSDSSRSHLFQVVRTNLHKLSAEIAHPRDWRPIILAFTNSPQRRERLIRFANWIEGGSGFTTAVTVVEQSGAVARLRRKELQAEMLADFKKRHLDTFSLAVCGAERTEAIGLLLQSFGIGPIQVNTVLLNWFDQDVPDADAPGLPEYGQYLRTALRFECNLVILNATAETMQSFENCAAEDRQIDVWYLDESCGQLMLLLAYLMTRSAEWSEASIRVLAPAGGEMGPEETQSHIEAMLADFRIQAKVTVVEVLTAEVVAEHSRAATLVFLPFRLVDESPVGPLGGSLDQLLRQLPLTALTMAAQEFDLDAEPEHGVHEEIARAVDTAEDVRKKANQFEREAQKAIALAEESREKLDRARERGADPQALAALEAESESAEREADELKRRAAKIKRKADDAEQHVEDVTARTNHKV